MDQKNQQHVFPTGEEVSQETQSTGIKFDDATVIGVVNTNGFCSGAMSLAPNPQERDPGPKSADSDPKSDTRDYPSFSEGNTTGRDAMRNILDDEDFNTYRASLPSIHYVSGIPTLTLPIVCGALGYHFHGDDYYICKFNEIRSSILERDYRFAIMLYDMLSSYTEYDEWLALNHNKLMHALNGNIDPVPRNMLRPHGHNNVRNEQGERNRPNQTRRRPREVGRRAMQGAVADFMAQVNVGNEQHAPEPEETVEDYTDFYKKTIAHGFASEIIIDKFNDFIRDKHVNNKAISFCNICGHCDKLICYHHIVINDDKKIAFRDIENPVNLPNRGYIGRKIYAAKHHMRMPEQAGFDFDRINNPNLADLDNSMISDAMIDANLYTYLRTRMFFSYKDTQGNDNRDLRLEHLRKLSLKFNEEKNRNNLSQRELNIQLLTIQRVCDQVETNFLIAKQKPSFWQAWGPLLEKFLISIMIQILIMLVNAYVLTLGFLAQYILLCVGLIARDYQVLSTNHIIRVWARSIVASILIAWLWNTLLFGNLIVLILLHIIKGVIVVMHPTMDPCLNFADGDSLVGHCLN